MTCNVKIKLLLERYVTTIYKNISLDTDLALGSSQLIVILFALHIIVYELLSYQSFISQWYTSMLNNSRAIELWKSIDVGSATIPDGSSMTILQEQDALGKANLSCYKRV